MEHQHRRSTRGIALFTLFVGTLAAGPSARAQQAPPPEPPPPQGYAPPQQVYTVDVYEQPQYPQQAYQPEARPTRPRRVVVPYEDGMPIPEGGFVRTVSRKGLWIPGLAIFAASYFVTAGVGSLVQAVRDDTSNGLAWVPVVGGYLIADHPDGRRAAVFSILAQSAGLTMLIAGLSIRRRQLVYYTDSGRGLMFGAAPLRGGAMLSLNVF